MKWNEIIFNCPTKLPSKREASSVELYFFRSFLPVIRNLNWHYAISDEMTNDAI